VNAAILTVSILTAAALLLWWTAPAKNGVRWAQMALRRRFPDIPVITPAALSGWLHDLRRVPPLLIDARTPEEQAVSTLPGALCALPDADPEAEPGDAGRNRPVVVYCAAGYRGARMARRLMQAGWTHVFNLDGGIFAWANEGFPLRNNGQPEQKVHPYRSVFSLMLNRNSR